MDHKHFFVLSDENNTLRWTSHTERIKDLLAIQWLRQRSGLPAPRLALAQAVPRTAELLRPMVQVHGQLVHDPARAVHKVQQLCTSQQSHVLRDYTHMK